MKKFRFVFALGAVVFFSLTILLTGCGGGGDEQSSGVINYSGSTTEAAVTSINATEITKAAYQGGEFASAMIIGAVIVADDTGVGYSLPLRLPKVLKNVLGKIDFSSEQIAAGADVRLSDSFPGSCGGTASYTITGYNLTGNFSGSLKLDNYCEENNILSGGASFSGRLNRDTSDFVTITISFNAITYTKGSTTFTLKGQVDVDYSVNPYTISYDIVAKDNVSKKTFWWNTYKIEITDGTDDDGISYEDFLLSGKFYHPDYGYVTVSTLTPFRFNSDSATPSTGVLLVTGKTGTAGGSNTSAELIVLSTATYHIIADADGNASYEWDSDILYWQ
jgi:hypothetical protein